MISKSESTVLPLSFYQSDDVVDIAKQLLGKLVTTHINDQITSGIIVETEAYRGPEDRGSHAYGGKYTARNKSMYMQGGHAYIYICYGIHPMLNVVTAPENIPHAVLIRAIQPIDGLSTMQVRRSVKHPEFTICNGPGKLAVALGITKHLDGCSLNSPIISISASNVDPDFSIVSGPRVGMSHNVGKDAHLPWRFYIKNNPWVSKPLHVDYTGKW